MARVPRFLDVSVPLTADVPTHPGNPVFQFEPVKRLANGDSANVSRMVMGTHAGTDVDAPLHFSTMAHPPRRWR
jgi:arylformamidase